MSKEIEVMDRGKFLPKQSSRRGILRVLKFAGALLVLTAPLATAFADTGNGYLTDHGVTIYYAIVPAEMIRGHAKDHPEATMHGGVPNRPHTHHLMVALFDAKSLNRIVDAKVTATVGEAGLSAVTKELQPFAVADALTYGNCFVFHSRQDYVVRVDVTLTRPGNSPSVKFQFKH